MKTKELMAALAAADPSGELEVCCRNIAITRVGVLGAYENGVMQILDLDGLGRIVGARFPADDDRKVMLSIQSIAGALSDNPDLSVDTLGIEQFENYVEGIRTQARAARTACQDIVGD